MWWNAGGGSSLTRRLYLFHYSVWISRSEYPGKKLCIVLGLVLHISSKCLFWCIKRLQCHELTRRCSHLPCALTSSYICTVCPFCTSVISLLTTQINRILTVFICGIQWFIAALVTKYHYSRFSEHIFTRNFVNIDFANYKNAMFAMFDYCGICRIIVTYWKNYYRPFATIKIRFGFNHKDLKRKENGTKSSPVFGDKTDRTEMDTLKKHGPNIILQQVFGRRCSWSIWLQASLSDLRVLVCLVCFTIY